MLTTAYYFLQVVLCSSVMMGYYWLVLRNKRFHQYNRFYLLGVALLSWCIPLVKINVAKPVDETAPQLINWVNIVAGNNSEIEQIVVQKGFAINWDMVVVSLYTCVSAIFLFSIVIALIRVYSLLRKYSCKNLGDVYIIMTNNVKGTPFSFFKYIFWNDAVDIQTHTGQQMMQHELAHVREKHSVDKIFMQLIMMFGWFNPFFWLLKKELNLIHEFIADNKAIKNGDASSLAAMLLAAAYPNQQYLLTNPFFFSPIKRRILMLTKTNNPRLSYARRVVVLPLLAVTVMLFAFRKKDAAKSTLPLSKVYTVVIDAGHGGKDFGAAAADGTKEKDLALLMLKAIKNTNTSEKIKLVFTREEDIYQSPIEKAKFVNEQKADLFISLHINWAAKDSKISSGVEINISKNDGNLDAVEQSKLFALSINQSLAKSFKSNGIKTQSKSIWVLKESNCPAALIECGFISNPTDLALMKDEKQRNKMAELILEGVGNYLANNGVAAINSNEGYNANSSSLTVNELASNDRIEKSRYKNYIANDTKATEIFNLKANVLVMDGSGTLYDDSSKMQKVHIRAVTDSTHKGTVKRASVIMGGQLNNDQPTLAKETSIQKMLIILDGTPMAFDDFKKVINMSDVDSIRLYRKPSELAQYGEIGKNGVMVVITKKKKVPVTMLSPLNNSYVKEKFGKNLMESKISYRNDGTKICSKTDSDVKSIAIGTVTFAGKISDEQVVIVRGNDKFVTYAGMNSTRLQKKGQAVSVGTSIGEAGRLDNENYVMLMVSDKKGQFVDPESLLAAR